VIKSPIRPLFLLLCLVTMNLFGHAAAQAAQAALAGGIPIYQPASVVSRTADTYASLRSPDSVGKVNDYYATVLARNGWRVVSHFHGPYNASFSARRAGRGVSISIYRAWNATGISLSTYLV
jgi:hypothetical protein